MKRSNEKKIKKNNLKCSVENHGKGFGSGIMGISWYVLLRSEGCDKLQ